MSTDKTYQTLFLPESDYQRWSDFVAASPDGSIYSTAEYLDILCGATGANFRILAVMQQDEIVGGAALYIESASSGLFVAPRLLLFYNGLVLREYGSENPHKRYSRQIKIMSEIEQALRKANLQRVVLKSRGTVQDVRPFLSAGWRSRVAYSFEVDISDPDSTWQRIDQNQRRLVKRCEKEGLIFAADDDFDGFFRLHAQTHSRKGAPLYLPEKAYREYYRRLSAAGLGRMYHARLAGGEAIASQLVLLGSHPVTHTVSASADAAYLNMGANAFLRWNVFRDLSAKGYRANDLTDAALNPVTRFKSQLGGDLRTSIIITRPDSFRFWLKDALGTIARDGKEHLGALLNRSSGD